MYGRGGHLGDVTQTSRTNFRSPIPLRLHVKFGFDWPSGLEKKVFENGGRTDGQRADDGPWLYYKLTNEPKGSGLAKKPMIRNRQIRIIHRVKIKIIDYKHQLDQDWH